MDVLITALILATITERITAALVAPVKQKWPTADTWWLIYVAWVLGAVLTFLAGVNLVAELVPGLSPLAGQVLSAVIVGGGANLIHDVTQRPPTQRITATSASAGMMTATVRTEEPKE